MLIADKLPPKRVDKTFFSSGRAAFSFLVGQVIKPKKVYLPTFTCWSVVAAMARRFPDIPVEYYPVERDLTCLYPAQLHEGELLHFIHYFGHENRCKLPASDGTILEDASHSYMSDISPVGDYVFGSYRKLVKVGDGGFVQGYFNPIYEPSRKLDTWLRYEAADWKDVREAENMLDRDWQIADISGQSLAVILAANHDLIRLKRRANERFLAENITAGTPLIKYRPNECPLLHSRLFETKEERDCLRAFLAAKGVYASIHWPTPQRIKESGAGIAGALWLESHILCLPVSQDYGLNDMEYIALCIREWQGD